MWNMLDHELVKGHQEEVRRQATDAILVRAARRAARQAKRGVARAASVVELGDRRPATVEHTMLDDVA